MDSKSPSATPPPNVPDVTDREPAEEAQHKTQVVGEQSVLVNRDLLLGKEKGALATAGHVKTVELMGVSIVALIMDGQERLCLAQISSTLLKQYSYNEIHNRRVALGITCVQCTPVQLEILRRAGAMPVSSRRCGMITKREAERLCKSFLTDNSPPKLPDNFSFEVQHRCAWGCRGKFTPSRYNSSRAKCVQCVHCRMFFSPNKFIFHSHRFTDSSYTQPDAANFNSWRRHLHLTLDADRPDHIVHAWEDVKAMFNGGTRKRFMAASVTSTRHTFAPRKMAETATSNIPSQKSTSVSSGLRQQNTGGSGQSQRKTHHGLSISGFHPSNANIHSSLYCNPFRYSQQLQHDTPASVSWLCGPHALHPYAALAAAAAAAATVQQPASTSAPSGCWFPYPPFLQPANMIHQLTNPTQPALISPPIGPLEINPIPDDSANTAPGRGSNAEQNIPDSAFSVVQANDLAASCAHMTKEKLQEMLMSEIRARKRLENDLMQLKGSGTM